MWELLFILIAFALQSALFSRLIILGVFPDILLVSIVVFSVILPYQKGLMLSGLAGFLQDISSNFMYFNLFFKAIISTLINVVKDNYDADPLQLAFICVAVVTPLSLLIEVVVLNLIFGSHINIIFLIKSMFLKTIYNLILTPFIYNLLKNFSHEK